MPTERSPWDLSRAELDEVLAGQPRFRIDQVWKGLYERGVAPEEMTDLPKALRAELAEAHPPALERVTRQVSASGDTVKSLWTLPGGARVETVLMHYEGRSTVCISSQAGCGMACGFCATGQAGLERNLSVGEIVEQVVRARDDAGDRRLSNVVFMGMGEPFANYRRVMEAARRITGDLGIGARKLTVSTVGVVPRILEFASEGLQVGLAISLHAARDDLRSELVPLNDRWPIDEVVDAARAVRSRTGRRVSFEWAMIDGVNDTDRDVVELAEVARRADAHVNLIPLNPTPGWPTTGTPAPRVRAFAEDLKRRGVNATVRANRGTDIDAACGQLRARHRDSGAATPVTLGRP